MKPPLRRHFITWRARRELEMLNSDGMFYVWFRVLGAPAVVGVRFLRPTAEYLRSVRHLGHMEFESCVRQKRRQREHLVADAADLGVPVQTRFILYHLPASG